jgi:hypothetical protein
MIKTILALIILLYGVANVIADDAGTIRKLLADTFDKPDARLVVDPVAVSGDYAIAGWSQGDLGGRALLRRRGGEWSLILCSGDGITSVAALRRAGLPPEHARKLSARLSEAEKTIPRERLALFARFAGTVTMEAGGGHPHVEHHQ